MKSSTWLWLSLLAGAGLAQAQDAPPSGIAESTDPARIARIEQHARELSAAPQQQAEPVQPAPKMRGRHHRMHHPRAPQPAAPKPAAPGS